MSTATKTRTAGRTRPPAAPLIPAAGLWPRIYSFDLNTFATAWAPIAATTSKGLNRPVLTCVAVEHHLGGLRLIATDSYVLATIWVPARLINSVDVANPNDPGLNEAPLAASLVPAHNLLARQLLKPRSGSRVLDLTFTTDGPAPGLDITVDGDGTAVIDTVDGTYPQWRQFFTDFKPGPCDRIALGHPCFSRLLAWLGANSRALTFEWSDRGATGPVRVTNTATGLVALAMPVRLP